MPGSGSRIRQDFETTAMPPLIKLSASCTLGHSCDVRGVATTAATTGDCRHLHGLGALTVDPESTVPLTAPLTHLYAGIVASTVARSA